MISGFWRLVSGIKPTNGGAGRWRELRSWGSLRTLAILEEEGEKNWKSWPESVTLNR
jgi:hypothetical protein